MEKNDKVAPPPNPSDSEGEEEATVEFNPTTVGPDPKLLLCRETGCPFPPMPNRRICRKHKTAMDQDLKRKQRDKARKEAEREVRRKENERLAALGGEITSDDASRKKATLEKPAKKEVKTKEVPKAAAPIEQASTTTSKIATPAAAPTPLPPAPSIPRDVVSFLADMGFLEKQATVLPEWLANQLAQALPELGRPEAAITSESMLAKIVERALAGPIPPLSLPTADVGKECGNVVPAPSVIPTDRGDPIQTTSQKLRALYQRWKEAQSVPSLAKGGWVAIHLSGRSGWRHNLLDAAAFGLLDTTDPCTLVKVGDAASERDAGRIYTGKEVPVTDEESGEDDDEVSKTTSRQLKAVFDSWWDRSTTNREQARDKWAVVYMSGNVQCHDNLDTAKHIAKAAIETCAVIQADHVWSDLYGIYDHPSSLTIPIPTPAARPTISDVVPIARAAGSDDIDERIKIILGRLELIYTNWLTYRLRNLAQFVGKCAVVHIKGHVDCYDDLDHASKGMLEAIEYCTFIEVGSDWSEVHGAGHVLDGKRIIPAPITPKAKSPPTAPPPAPHKNPPPPLKFVFGKRAIEIEQQTAAEAMHPWRLAKWATPLPAAIPPHTLKRPAAESLPDERAEKRRRIEERSHEFKNQFVEWILNQGAEVETGFWLVDNGIWRTDLMHYAPRVPGYSTLSFVQRLILDELIAKHSPPK